MSLLDAIGKTPLVEIPSLSRMSKCRILIKCEQQNPGGSVKDRAAKSMVLRARERGDLRDGMTIVEGSAGNTGIGLALVGRALGHPVVVVMPNNQAREKESMVSFAGAELRLVDPCPFADQRHFYHVARQIAEASPEEFWWANQFENTDNHLAHLETTGPEIWEQSGGHVDFLVSVAGTGGTIAGCSKYLKSKNSNLKTVLVDPEGSGLASYIKTGEFKASGSSITEGIGIMRLVANFREAIVDEAVSYADQKLVTLAHYLRESDGISLGSSAALNVLAAYDLARRVGPGKTIVTFWCDGGERSRSKLYDLPFLKSRGITTFSRTTEKCLEEILAGC